MKSNSPLSKVFYLLSFIGSLSIIGCDRNPKTSSDETTIKITGNQTYSDTATSSVKVFNENGKVCIQQSNTYYEVVDAYEGTAKIPLLLKIKKTELCYADSVNKHRVYEISAKSVMDTKNIQWQNQFVATGLVFTDNTILAVHEGIDQQEDFLRRFSLLDGKEVFSCSYGGVKVAIPNVRTKRFIGYTSKRAAGEPLKEMKEENLLGIIAYGSSVAPGKSLIVKLKRSKVAAKIPISTPDIVLVALNGDATIMEDGKSVGLMKTDEHYQPKDVKDFAVKFTFYYGDDNESTNIIIPIVNDQLDLPNAKYDKEIFDIAVTP